MVLAYAHNNWKSFDIISGTGQRRAYLEGKEGTLEDPIKEHIIRVPRPIVYETVQLFDGEGPTVTRISGEGNPGILEMDNTMYDLILKKEHGGKILYKSGAGPIDAKIVDPLKIKDGKYRLEITGSFNYARANCAYDDKTVWKLTDVTNNKVVLQDRSLAFIKEYILNNLSNT